MMSWTILATKLNETWIINGIANISWSHLRGEVMWFEWNSSGKNALQNQSGNKRQRWSFFCKNFVVHSSEWQRRISIETWKDWPMPFSTLEATYSKNSQIFNMDSFSCQNSCSVLSLVYKECYCFWIKCQVLFSNQLWPENGETVSLAGKQASL